MKKVTTILAAILLMAVGATAQKLSYSAVVRNSDNELVVNANLTVAVSIANSSGGAVVYSETHNVTTNQNGLVTLTIGDGTGVTGSMSDVTWQTAFITSDYTLPNGSHVVNTTPVTAVPYALYADSPTARFQWLSVMGYWLLRGGFGTAVEIAAAAPERPKNKN